MHKPLCIPKVHSTHVCLLHAIARFYNQFQHCNLLTLHYTSRKDWRFSSFFLLMSTIFELFHTIFPSSSPSTPPHTQTTLPNMSHVQRQQQYASTRHTQYHPSNRTMTKKPVSMLSQLKSVASKLSNQQTRNSKILQVSRTKLQAVKACQRSLQECSTKLSVQEANFSSFAAALDDSMRRSDGKLQEFHKIDGRSMNSTKLTSQFINQCTFVFFYFVKACCMRVAWRAHEDDSHARLRWVTCSSFFSLR